jgi:hypothetical protein
MAEEQQYRVRMTIYRMDATPDDAEVWTDEPLYNGNPDDEMAMQAHRTHRKFLTHLATEQ